MSGLKIVVRCAAIGHIPTRWLWKKNNIAFLNYRLWLRPAAVAPLRALSARRFDGDVVWGLRDGRLHLVESYQQGGQRNAARLQPQLDSILPNTTASSWLGVEQSCRSRLLIRSSSWVYSTSMTPIFFQMNIYIYIHTHTQTQTYTNEGKCAFIVLIISKIHLAFLFLFFFSIVCDTNINKFFFFKKMK